MITKHQQTPIEGEVSIVSGCTFSVRCTLKSPLHWRQNPVNISRINKIKQCKTKTIWQRGIEIVIHINVYLSIQS